jgi:hypothetical protein
MTVQRTQPAVSSQVAPTPTNSPKKNEKKTLRKYKVIVQKDPYALKIQPPVTKALSKDNKKS